MMSRAIKSQEIDCKTILAWLNDGGISEIINKCKKIYSCDELIFSKILEINQDFRPNIDDYCLANNKHVGHFSQISEAKNLFNKRIPFVLVGSPGTGKTTIARQIARESDHHLVEVNASDVVKDDLPRGNRTITGKKLALLLDEADRGTRSFQESVMSLSKLEKSSDEKKNRVWPYPIIFTANFAEKFKIKADIIQKIEIKPLEHGEIASILIDRAKKMGLGVESCDRIYEIASSCKGDVRMAINAIDHGNIIVQEEIDAMKIATAMFTINPDEIAELVENNYDKITFLSMIASTNLQAPFSRNVLDNQVLCVVDRLKFTINKVIIASLLSILQKFPKVKLSYPKSYKIKENEKT